MERKKVAVVGLNFGEWVIENELLHGAGKDYFKMTAVCDLNKEKAGEFARRYGVTAYDDMEVMLNSEDLDGVVLITGPHNRAKLIHKLLDYSKPVMTTKPFDTSGEETLNVLRRAQELNIPVFMNSPTPIAGNELMQIEKWRTQYALGELMGYHASTYCSYRENADGSWYDDPELCPAAPVTRLGIYLLNDLCRFFRPVKDVSVMQSRIFTGRPTADNAQLSIVHEGGCIGSIYASFCIEDLQYYRCAYELNFERGTVYKNAGVMVHEDIDLELCANVGGTAKTEYCTVKKEGAGYQWDNFYKAMEGIDIGPTIAPEKTAAAIRILELMKEKCNRLDI